MASTLVARVVIPQFLLDGYRAELDAAAGDRARFVSGDDPALLGDAQDQIDVVVTGIDKDLLERLVVVSSVRWVHSITAGVEHLPLDAMAERRVVLTSSAGAYATAMVEYALSGMVMLARNLPYWLSGQRERRWLPIDSSPGITLRGKRLGIVGYGAIGRELASAAVTLGMEVWATKRSPLILSSEPLDRLLPATALNELLSSCDFVVLSASLNHQTQELIGKDELGLMKPTAGLINLARGALIDEAALSASLREGKLRGAMIDVTREEPLPADSELWDTPNLFITPHISGNTPESWRTVIELFSRNLQLYLDGSPDRMGNLVDYSAVL